MSKTAKGLKSNLYEMKGMKRYIWFRFVPTQPGPRNRQPRHPWLGDHGLLEEPKSQKEVQNLRAIFRFLLFVVGGPKPISRTGYDCMCQRGRDGLNPLNCLNF